tara:strand:+ start:53 stop:1300 length:1248 start_codon:yes stop_codon:yes gene_type:complete
MLGGRLTTWLPLAMLVLLGLLASYGHLLVENRGHAAVDGIPSVIPVSSARDRGPDSLRSALFLAMKANHRVTIQLDVPLIELEVALPPVLSSNGVTIRGGLDVPTVLKNVATDPDQSAILRLLGNNIDLHDFTLDAAGAPGIAVFGEQATVAGVEVRNAGIGLSAVNPVRLTVRDSRFIDNIDGIRIQGSTGSATIVNSVISGNRENGIWLVFNEPAAADTASITIHGNRINAGRNGLVGANTVADFRNNYVSGFSRIGLMLMASRAAVVDNRIVDSNGIGMHLSNMQESFVYENEIGSNSLVGILILDADGLQVANNNIYSNGYGIVTVGREPIAAALRSNVLADQKIDGLIAIGDTPIIDGNHALRNSQAGIRVLDLLLPDIPVIAATQRYTNNVLRDNGSNTVLQGEFVVHP